MTILFDWKLNLQLFAEGAGGTGTTGGEGSDTGAKQRSPLFLNEKV